MNEEVFAFTVKVQNIGRAHVYAFLSGRLIRLFLFLMVFTLQKIWVLF